MRWPRFAPSGPFVFGDGVPNRIVRAEGSGDPLLLGVQQPLIWTTDGGAPANSVPLLLTDAGGFLDVRIQLWLQHTGEVEGADQATAIEILPQVSFVNIAPIQFVSDFAALAKAALVTMDCYTIHLPRIDLAGIDAENLLGAELDVEAAATPAGTELQHALNLTTVTVTQYDAP
jgi:hypothetical protein